MGGAPIPDNAEFSWSRLDELKDGAEGTQLIVDVLAMVNDVLSAKDSKLYFGIIPSAQNGIEIAWFERGKE